MIIVPLSRLLAYDNQRLVQYHAQKHAIDSKEAHRRLGDWLGWVWLLAHRKKQQKETYLFGPLLALDELWHDFLLHTRDYDDFCQLYLDVFLHHDIVNETNVTKISTEYLCDFLEDAYIQLGESWVERNFQEALQGSLSIQK